MPKKKSRRVPRTRPGETFYKQWCDNHPNRRATYAFREAKTGEDRGLCRDCFEEERRIAMRKLRIKKARSRRK